MPEIGDEVIVRYTVRPPMVDGLIIQGQRDRVETATGILGVELDGSGSVAGLVLEGDGSATFIPKSAVITVEVLS